MAIPAFRFIPHGEHWTPWLWGRPGSHPGNAWQRIVRVLLLTQAGFHRNHLSTRASSLTFFLLLSVVPFLAFVLQVLRVMGVADYLRPHLLGFVAGGNPALVPRIEEYIRNAQSGMVGSVGIVITLWVGVVLLLRVKTALNVVWEVQSRRGYRYRLIESLAVLLLAPVALALAFGVTGLLGSERVLRYLPDFLIDIVPSVSAANLAGYVVLLLLSFYAIRWLPDTRVQTGPALLGAVLSATGLVLVQKSYVVLMVLVSQQSPIYGALALLPFLMVWFYVAWLILLAAAQLAFVVQHYTRELERHRAGLAAGAYRPYLAILVLAYLVREMEGRGQGVNRRALARRLRLPADSIQEVLTTLTLAKLITPVDSDPDRYVAQDALERLTVLQVLERCELVPGFPGLPLWPGHRQGYPVLTLFQEANRAMATPLAASTLRDVATQLSKVSTESAPADEAAPAAD